MLNWNKSNTLIFTLLFFIFGFRPSIFPVIIAVGLLSFTIYWILNVNRLGKLRPFAGYANWITLFRLLMVVYIGFFYDTLSHHSIFSLALFSVIIDGLDGYIARKFNQKSTFGLFFDMETDAFYVMVITSIIFMEGMFGFWLVIVGYLRYLYGTLSLFIRVYERESTRTKFRSIIAGIFFVAILSPFILPPNIHFPVVITASTLLVFSFIISFVMIFLPDNRVKES